MKVRLDHPWLIAEFPESRRILSWSLNRPGFTQTHRIVWREVRNADLPRELDARFWLRSELAAAGLGDCVCLLTSRDISSYTRASSVIEGERADVVATVGLSNAERVGARGPALKFPGTINIAIATSSPLSDGALLEAMSLAAEARTLAVLEANLAVTTGAATGTGTDCIALAAPPGETAHAGKHTAIGEAVGDATLQAMRKGVAAWMNESKREDADAAR